eukprot:jgi/Psemu1/197729/e_gw1.209.55.1
MKVIEGSTRIAFLCFFLSHIPITLFVDSQGLFGPYYPRILTDVVAWYCDLFGDVVMKHAPSVDYAWFSSLIVCEILFQLPFFVVIANKLMVAAAWFRIACIIYGSHVSTTLVPILATFVASREMTVVQKCATTAIYSPYLIFPLWLLWLAARESLVGVKQERKIE